MRLSTRKSGSLLGVDIGSAAVKLVELSGSAETPRVQACAIEPLPAHNISDADADGAIGDAIRRAWRRSGATTRRAAAAVPCSAAIAKTIALDAALSDREMELEVAVEAERLLPFGEDELALDFEPLNLNAADPSLTDVLVVACRQDQIAARETALRQASLKPALVDVETYCLQRAALGATKATGAFAVLDAGAASVLLLALEDDEVLFSREESFAGTSTFETSGESAYGEEALRLAERLLRQFASTCPAHRLERLLVTGGGARAIALAASTTARLALPVEVADPFAGMEFAEHVDVEWARRNAPAFATACGLALSAFDDLGGLHRCCA